MRKLILALSLVAFMASSGVAFAVDDPTLAGWDNKSKFAQQVPGKGGSVQTTVLKYVRFSSRAADGPNVASRDVLVYDTVSDDGITVALSTTSADGAIAGIAVTAITTSDTNATSSFDDQGRRNWGWMLVHGKTTAKATAGGTNGHGIGDAFITSTDSGAITSPISFDTQGVALSFNKAADVAANTGGFFMDAADGTSTSYDVFVTLE